MKHFCRLIFVLTGLTLILAQPLTATTPPRDGGPMPDWFQERLEEDRNFLSTEYGWRGKVERARKARDRYIAERGFYNKDLVTAQQKAEMAVGGDLNVPVFLSKFANTPGDPFPVPDMQAKLFDGPSGGSFPQTLSEFYTEASYGNINLTGTVYGWTPLSQDDLYYEGPSGCNGTCGDANLDQYMVETLDGNDGAVDFGQFDNDGPDNIPNSGDDDGFVDFVAFVHPEVGAECGGTPYNIWSHRFSLNWLLGAPYTTNDPAAGGGFIRVNDYVIQPIYNCDGSSMIDIGVFAHEFGHALGLPDLYDTNGGSSGIGHWGLMGSGSWNSPDEPAHFCTWSKEALGWMNIVEAGTDLATYDVPNVGQTNTAYRLNIMGQRWRRMTDCAIAGSYSMRCGLLTAEAAPRGWIGLDGYGDGWNEKLSRDFYYDGVGAVTLAYDYSHDSEPAYDYTYLRITKDGVVTDLVDYDGVGSGTEVVNLTPYLTSPGPYTISFEFESDAAYSDRDGDHNSTCGPFVVDEILLSGGGEFHTADFETREDGWFPDLSSPAEHFLVENRQPVGSDVNLWGSGGLVIWHVNQDVARTGQRGNQGGDSNSLPRGVMPEQADNLFNLEAGTNRGDENDPFPGGLNQTEFSNASTPNSRSYDGFANQVVVTNIGANPADGGSMSADMSGGWIFPTFTSCTPSTGMNDEAVAVVVMGATLAPGTTIALNNGSEQVTGSGYYYDGYDRLTCSFDLNGIPNGLYDIVVTNPSGGAVVEMDGFQITGGVAAVGDLVPAANALRQNYPNPFNPSTVIAFDLKDRGAVTLRIYDIRGQVVRTLVDEVMDASTHRVSWHGLDDRGRAVGSGIYFYKLEAPGFQDVRKLTLMK